MTNALQSFSAGASFDRRGARPLGVFVAWRLYSYGFTLAALQAMLLLSFYFRGIWPVDRSGVPVYKEFTVMFVAGLQALHGKAASIYIPEEFLRAQDALVGAGHSLFANLPWPPAFLLVLAPLAMLPYLAAFLTWNLATLTGCSAVAYFIVRRRPAIAIALASPFNVLNVITGQMAFLTASLTGGALLLLERRPMLSGFLIGCLIYKPQFGILLPVALVAAKQWRVFVSAAVSTTLLAGASAVVFGVGTWEAYPRELMAVASFSLFADPDSLWGKFQSVYGLIRILHGGGTLGWVAQSLTTFGVAGLVWLVWRSPVRYPLKAATLSAATLIATPYAFAYDFAAIAIPVAFLARDEISHGLLRGEQVALIALFGAGFAMVVTAGSTPLGPLVIILLLYLILRRDPSWWIPIHRPVKNWGKFSETTPSAGD